jgi:hypothetical protein
MRAKLRSLVEAPEIASGAPVERTARCACNLSARGRHESAEGAGLRTSPPLRECGTSEHHPQPHAATARRSSGSGQPGERPRSGGRSPAPTIATRRSGGVWRHTAVRCGRNVARSASRGRKCCTQVPARCIRPRAERASLAGVCRACTDLPGAERNGSTRCANRCTKANTPAACGADVALVLPRPPGRLSRTQERAGRVRLAPA